MPLGSYTSAAFTTATGVAVAASADVEVRRESDSALASIFSDRAGSAAITQPGFQADSEGRFVFYAAGISGGYQVKVTKGAETYTARYQATGVAREYDATSYGALLMAAVDAAAARTLIEVAAQAERVGSVALWPGPATPANAFDCDGAPYSRTTYAALFAKLVKSAIVTMTIASPCVVTWTAHGLKNHMPVKFTTTGALPTGLIAGRTYWIVNQATDTFQLAATPGGTAINTSGSQSGVHTGICATCGDGDGSTTFNVPNLNDAVPVGFGAAAISEAFAPADVTTGTDSIAVPDNIAKWITGMAVVFTTTGTAPSPLVGSTTYYVIRTGNNSIKLASSLANAQNGTVIDLTTQGTGVHTITHSRATRGLGELMGEDAHAQSSTELLLHLHNAVTSANSAGGAGASVNVLDGGTQRFTGNAGGNAHANITQPGVGMRYVIYYA